MNARFLLIKSGFTLIEMVVTIGIMVVLAGLIYTGLAPVREKAVETHCMNNLMQISKAIQMYRDDYGGGDPPGARTYAQLGLPRGFGLLWPYLRSRDVFTCTREYWGPDEGKLSISYAWHIKPDELARPPIPPFSEIVTKRGNDTPLLSDYHHGMLFRSAAGDKVKVIVVRLGGQVDQLQSPRNLSGWER